MVSPGMLRRVALVRTDVSQEPSTSSIYRRTSFSLLREWIHYTRRELDTVSRELLKLHLLLASTLSAVDWDLIDRITNEKVLRLAEDVRARHCRKFMQLHKTQHATGPLDTSRTVINLIRLPLEEAACSTLSNLRTTSLVLNGEPSGP
jgi:hypothetical protein